MPLFILKNFVALSWYLGALIMIHMSVIRLANRAASGLDNEISLKDDDVQRVALDESQAITNGLDEGVVILDDVS